MKRRAVWICAGASILVVGVWLALASAILLLRAGLWGHFTWPERGWAWAEYAWFYWSDPSVWPMLDSSAEWAALGTAVLAGAAGFRAWSLLRRRRTPLLYGSTEWADGDELERNFKRTEGPL